MKNQRAFFIAMRAVGLLAIIALFLRSEWRFVGGYLPHALNPTIQLYAVGSVLILPLFWVLLAVTLIGHFGKCRVDRRMKEPAADE